MVKGKQKSSGNRTVRSEMAMPCVSGIGTGKIHSGAVASIVRRAACSVDGVARITGSSLVDNIAEFVGSKRIQDRAIAIEMGTDTLSVELSINIRYGVSLPALAAEVQNTVASEIRTMTGLNVAKVNVLVREIEDPADEETAEEQ